MIYIYCRIKKADSGGDKTNAPTEFNSKLSGCPVSWVDYRRGISPLYIISLYALFL